MLREILINLLYIVAILGLLSLAYCIIVGVIETQIDRKKRKVLTNQQGCILRVCSRKNRDSLTKIN